MTNHLIPFGAFAIALLFLIIRLVTGKKRDFIISIVFVLIGSGYAAYTLRFSTLNLFFAAIAVSFIGDLLMAKWIRITQHRTIDGIMAFGIAHIIYIFAYNQLNLGGFRFLEDWYLVLIGIVLCVGLYKLTSTGGDLHYAIKLSNGIYAIIITSMFVIVMTFVFAIGTPLLVRFIAAVGVLLFVISDTVLAYNEFQNPIPRAKDIIAVTYILAQILLQAAPLLTLYIGG